MAYPSEYMAADLDALFAEQGEAAVYSRGADSVPVTVIFDELEVDTLVSEHVRADAVICEVRESELHAAPFSRQPARGDVISRELPAGEDGVQRLQQLEVVEPKRDEDGVWALICNQHIRLVP